MRNLRRRNRVPRVLAVSSGGGHWIQMKRLLPAFRNCQVTYATVKPARLPSDDGSALHYIPDANQDTKWKLVLLTMRLAWIILRVRPQVVISTGAAPGYLAIRLGRMLGAKTLFLDSIANAQQLSLSAKLARDYADVTLSQWKQVAVENNLPCWGAVL